MPLNKLDSTLSRQAAHQARPGCPLLRLSFSSEYTQVDDSTEGPAAGTPHAVLIRQYCSNLRATQRHCAGRAHLSFRGNGLLLNRGRSSSAVPIRSAPPDLTRRAVATRSRMLLYGRGGRQSRAPTTAAATRTSTSASPPRWTRCARSPATWASRSLRGPPPSPLRWRPARLPPRTPGEQEGHIRPGARRTRTRRWRWRRRARRAQHGGARSMAVMRSGVAPS